MLSAKTVPYIERAAYVKDSEVSTWIKNDELHKTPMVVVDPCKAQNKKLNEERLRVRRNFVERNESEQGFLMDDLRLEQASKRATDSPAGPVRSSSASSSTAMATGHCGVDLDHRQ